MRVFSYFFVFFVVFGLNEFSVASISDHYTRVPDIIVTKKKPELLTSPHKIVFTKQDIEDIGAISLSQALQELAGIQLQDMVSNGSQVLLSMRGFGANASSNTLLLVNGIPLTNPDLAPPDLNAIPLQEIEYVEIISGSESVLYGDQAVGGIINIITHQPKKDTISLSCADGSYNNQSCYVTFNNHFKNLKYAIGGLSSHTDNYRNHNNYKQNLLLGRLDYSYQQGKMGFSYKIANERMLYPGSLTALQVFQNRRQANNNIDFFKNWNGFYHFKQQHTINENWKLENDISRREVHGNGVLFAPFTQLRKIHFIKSQITRATHSMILTTGMDFADDRYNLNSLFGSTHDFQKKYSVFSILNIPVKPNVILSMGMRAAQQTNNFQSLSDTNTLNRAVATTFGTTFLLNKNLHIYFRRAGSFRFPKADENSQVNLAAHNLKTQTGISYESGIKWNWKKIITHFSMYQLNLENEIAFDPTQTPQQPFGFNRNLDPTVRRGLSLSQKYQMTNNLQLDGQYNYVHARFNNGFYSGNRIPLVAENIFHGGINYAITHFWNLYTEAIYTGNQYPDSDDANIGGKIGGYIVYNFNLRYHHKNFSADFRVNNIFNKYYYLYTVFIPAAQNTFFYPAAGRNFLFTIKYKFT